VERTQLDCRLQLGAHGLKLTLLGLGKISHSIIKGRVFGGGGAARGGPNYAFQRSEHKSKDKEAFITGVRGPKTIKPKANW
jgi:hypothetical protein